MVGTFVTSGNAVVDGALGIFVEPIEGIAVGMDAGCGRRYTGYNNCGH